MVYTTLICRIYQLYVNSHLYSLTALLHYATIFRRYKLTTYVSSEPMKTSFSIVFVAAAPPASGSAKIVVESRKSRTYCAYLTRLCAAEQTARVCRVVIVVYRRV